MKNNYKTYETPFGTITTLDNKKLLFTVTDLLKPFGKASNTSLYAGRLGCRHKCFRTIQYTVGKHRVICVDEFGMSQILNWIKDPRAKELYAWICKNVLGKDVEVPATPGNVVETYIQGLNSDQNKVINSMVQVFLDCNDAIAHGQGDSEFAKVIRNNKDLMTVTEIGQRYGVSAQEMHKILIENHILRKRGSRYYLLAKYLGLGYAGTITHTYTDKAGIEHQVSVLGFTLRGEEKLIYPLCKHLLDMNKPSIKKVADQSVA